MTFKPRSERKCLGEWNSISIPKVIVEDFAKKKLTQVTIKTFQLAGERGIGNSHGLRGLRKKRMRGNRRRREKQARLSSQQEGRLQKPNHKKGQGSPEKIPTRKQEYMSLIMKRISSIKQLQKRFPSSSPSLHHTSLKN